MKLRFGQPNDMQCGQKSERLPSGVPKPWEIDKLEKLRKKRPMVEDRPVVEVDERLPPPGYQPSERPPSEEAERGVVILQF
jgi:hypothetical protein